MELLNKQVFILQDDGSITDSYNYEDLLLENRDETTTPNGIGSRYHIRENGAFFDLWSWGHQGNHPRFVERFDNKESAEARLWGIWEDDLYGEDVVWSFDRSELI